MAWASMAMPMPVALVHRRSIPSWPLHALCSVATDRWPTLHDFSTDCLVIVLSEQRIGFENAISALAGARIAASKALTGFFVRKISM
jgi:hypothetical protein